MKKYIVFLVLAIANFTLYAQFIDQGIRPDIAQKYKIDINPIRSDIKTISLSHEIVGLPPVSNHKTLNSDFEPNPSFKKRSPEVLKKTQKKIDNLKEFYPDETNGSRTSNPVIGTNFQGNEYDGHRPPDNAMAISSSGYIVSLVNSTINYYNSDGTQLYSNTFNDFFNQYNYPLYDPKILYDSQANRFVMVILEGYTASHSIVKVCFSKSDNPLSGWWVYNFPGDQTGNGYWFDYPNIGISTNDLYITGNLYTGIGTNGIFQQSEVFMLQKGDGYNGQSIRWVYWIDFAFSPSTIVPASYGGNGNYGPGIYMIATTDYPRYLLYHVTADINHNPVMEAFSIPASFAVPGDALQLGTSVVLDNKHIRIRSAFYQSQTLHFVHSVENNSTGYSSIKYNRLSTWFLNNDSYTFGLDGYDYSYPSLAFNGSTPYVKDVLIGFLRSGSTIYPEFRVYKYDDSGTPSGSVQVKSGETYISVAPLEGVERWGDYTGISRKPGCSPEIWVSGCYGKSTTYHDHAYGTWIAQVTDGSDEITVTSPNGGENWKVGTTHTISWNSNLPTSGIYCGKVKIELYKGQVLEQEIISYYSSSTGSYAWTIPSDLTLGYYYQIKITSLTNHYVYDLSDNYFTVFDGVPEAPFMIFLTPVSTSRIDVNWNDVSYENGYKIYRSEDGGSSFTQIGITDANTTTFQDTGLSTYSMYCYKVEAFNAAGSSPFIGPACALTRNDPIIVSSPNEGEGWQQGTPQIISWFATISEDVIIELYLNDSYYSTISYGAPSTNDPSTDIGTFSWTIPFDQPISDYYKIKISSTIDSSAINDYSNNYFTISTPSPPLEPSMFYATVISYSQIDLGWGNVSNELGYKVHRSTEGSSFSQIGITDYDVTTFQDTGLLANTLYTYKVQPYNSAGSPEIINTLSFITPLAPFISVSTPNVHENLQQCVYDTISWSDNIEENVNIELYRNGNYNSTIASSVPYNNYLWYIPDNQIPDSLYQIKIISLTDTSLYDISDSCFTIEENVIANMLVQNTTINNGQTECFNATNMIIIAGADSSVKIMAGGDVTFIAGQKVKFEAGFIADSGSYVYAYITTTGDYCSQLQPMMATQGNTQEEAADIAESLPAQKDGVRVYPNPTTGRFVIDFMGKETTAEIQLMNFQGNRVINTTCNHQTKANIDISHLPHGMYVVVIKTQLQVITKKIVK